MHRSLTSRRTLPEVTGRSGRAVLLHDAQLVNAFRSDSACSAARRVEACGPLMITETAFTFWFEAGAATIASVPSDRMLRHSTVIMIAMPGNGPSTLPARIDPEDDTSDRTLPQVGTMVGRPNQ